MVVTPNGQQDVAEESGALLVAENRNGGAAVDADDDSNKSHWRYALRVLVYVLGLPWKLIEAIVPPTRVSSASFEYS